MKNYYESLEISPNSSEEVVKAAYKSLVKKYHPDNIKGDSVNHEEKMLEINEAYEMLSNVKKRQEYDQLMKNQYSEDRNRYDPNDEDYYDKEDDDVNDLKSGNAKSNEENDRQNMADQKKDRFDKGDIFTILFFIGTLVFINYKDWSNFFTKAWAVICILGILGLASDWLNKSKRIISKLIIIIIVGVIVVGIFQINVTSIFGSNSIIGTFFDKVKTSIVNKNDDFSFLLASNDENGTLNKIMGLEDVTLEKYVAENNIAINKFNVSDKVENYKKDDYNIQYLTLNNQNKDDAYFTYSESCTHFCYYGEIANGKPNGVGLVLQDLSITKSDGSTIDVQERMYFGEFKDGMYDGYGIVFSEYGSRNINSSAYSDLLNYYSKNGKSLENVVIDYMNPICYEGQFSKNLINGKCNYVLISESYDYNNGGISSINMSNSENGIYVGKAKGEPINNWDGNVKYYENGKLVYDCTYSFSFFVKIASRNGKGILYYSNGKVKYDGDFAANEYDGDGKLYFENGTLQYEGEFSIGEYNGKGKLYNSEGGLIYSGSFKKGTY
ncbi:DnaJ domain-containing protein [[Clostridium] fimetarium]|uniref:MORN repeat-containing protein n=1 Tax=[Clostridium] fimetarium TaxID=99656 RepID=A0A1I0Q0E1_9FIRM|nr:DnaJ domain-containing protein [[Clostridium] fimetarium]SEW20229.1 MORN repeat-containing protein [[Clostridium] fimetarium]